MACLRCHRHKAKVYGHWPLPLPGRQAISPRHLEISFGICSKLNLESFPLAPRQLAILDSEQAVTSTCQLLIVSDNDHRALIVAGNLQQQLDDRVAGVGIEISGRFVRIDD